MSLGKGHKYSGHVLTNGVSRCLETAVPAAGQGCGPCLLRAAWSYSRMGCTACNAQEKLLYCVPWSYGPCCLSDNISIICLELPSVPSCKSKQMSMNPSSLYLTGSTPYSDFNGQPRSLSTRMDTSIPLVLSSHTSRGSGCQTDGSFKLSFLR